MTLQQQVIHAGRSSIGLFTKQQRTSERCSSASRRFGLRLCWSTLGDHRSNRARLIFACLHVHFLRPKSLLSSSSPSRVNTHAPSWPPFGSRPCNRRRSLLSQFGTWCPRSKCEAHLLFVQLGLHGWLPCAGIAKSLRTPD